MKVYAIDIAPLYDPQIFKRYLSGVSAGRREKASRFRFPKDRNLSLAAGILIDRGLQEYGLRERGMISSCNQQGKPYFPSHPNIHFNVSHSGNLAIAAFSEHEVGCDVEEISEIELAIARNYFFADEYEFICKQSNLKDQQEAFFRLWTLKESFMKLVGLGMSLPLESFCITIGDDEIKVSQHLNNLKYYFKEYDVGSKYKISCCSTVPFSDNKIFWVELQ